MNHRPGPPASDDPANPQHSSAAESTGGHGGWGMMVLCCIPMVAVIVLAVALSR
ncbi:MAG: hypothetical protein HYX53_08505 [Chloroflexi bacterium]|nr:hypothetical protein [Chloroflexota bacterium]